MTQVNLSTDKILHSQCTLGWDRYSIEAPSDPWEKRVDGLSVFNLNSTYIKGKREEILECRADRMVFRLTPREARNLAEMLLQAAEASDEQTRRDRDEAAEYGQPMVNEG